MARLLRSVIGVYARLVSPLLPRSCRFYPTCSSYARQALEEYGAIHGTLLTLRRIARCHPWSPGGLDPIPVRKVL